MFRLLALLASIILSTATLQAAPMEKMDCVLIYFGEEENRQWDSQRFLPYTGYVGADGDIEDLFFEDYLFLSLWEDDHTKSYALFPNLLPTDQQDWVDLLDRLFEEDRQLAALDAAAEETASALELPDHRVDVWLMIPYPDARQREFGALPGKKKNLNFDASDKDRFAAVRWFAEETLDRWEEANLPRLRLRGFYWMQEGHMALHPPKEEGGEQWHSDDSKLMRRTASMVHDLSTTSSLGVMWIPYNEYGHDPEKVAFVEQWLEAPENEQPDVVMIQPNYFFAKWEKKRSFLEKITQFATAQNIGVEMEFNFKMFTDEDHRERFFDYMEVFQANEEIYSDGPIGYYQDIADIQRMAAREDLRYLYDKVYEFVSGRRGSPREE